MDQDQIRAFAFHDHVDVLPVDLDDFSHRAIARLDRSFTHIGPGEREPTEGDGGQHDEDGPDHEAQIKLAESVIGLAFITHQLGAKSRGKVNKNTSKRIVWVVKSAPNLS